MEYSDNMIADWIKLGYVEELDTALKITDLGLHDPVCNFIFNSLLDDTLSALAELDLIRLIYDVEEEDFRYVPTQTGLFWADKIKGME